MEKKTKIWLIVGLFIIAGIIAFALYKGFANSQETTITTSGGSTTTSTNGIGSILLKLFGI